jgi:hypothetical protein
VALGSNRRVLDTVLAELEAPAPVPAFSGA